MFAGDEIDSGVSAAHAQNFAVVVPATDELVALATELPVGRVSSTGKVSCSFVKHDIYEKFVALIGTGHELLRPDTNGADDLVTVSVPISQPDLWSTIGVGSTVLATVGREDGWWEAVVLAADPSSERLTLSWRDWPNLPSFSASRRRVALTAPSS
jgi:hypothetical protein